MRDVANFGMSFIEGATKILVPFGYGLSTLHWILLPEQQSDVLLLLLMWLLSILGVCALVWKLFSLVRRAVVSSSD